MIVSRAPPNANDKKFPSMMPELCFVLFQNSAESVKEEEYCLSSAVNICCSSGEKQGKYYRKRLQALEKCVDEENRFRQVSDLSFGVQILLYCFPDTTKRTKLNQNAKLFIFKALEM